MDEKFWDQVGEDQNEEKAGDRLASKQANEEQAASKDGEQRQEEQSAESESKQDEAPNGDGPEDDDASTAGDAPAEMRDNELDPHTQQEEAMNLPDDLALDHTVGHTSVAAWPLDRASGLSLLLEDPR